MHIRTALVALVLLFAGAAYAEKPDITGATFVNGVNCVADGRLTPCMVYEKQGVRYRIFRDDEEFDIILIYRVRSGATTPYKRADFELLWSKDQEETVLARND